MATDVPQMFSERKIWTYHRDFCDCTRSDPLPALILWTLFPVIALENSLSRAMRMAAAACRFKP